MANGLSVLMGLAKQPGSSGNIPSLSQDDQFLDDLVGEEDLYAAQDEIAARGRESGGAYAVPSRADLRKSARATVGRSLAPLRIQQEGANQRAAMQASGQRDALLRFLIGEQNKERRQVMGDEAALARAQATQGAQTERSAATQAALDRRAQNRERAITGRSQAAASMKRAGDIDKEVGNAGIWQSLLSMFGAGSLPGKRAEAQRLREQALSGYSSAPLPGDEDAGAADSDVIELDLTPEQLANLQGMLGGR